VLRSGSTFAHKFVSVFETDHKILRGSNINVTMRQIKFLPTFEEVALTKLKGLSDQFQLFRD